MIPSHGWLNQKTQLVRNSAHHPMSGGMVIHGRVTFSRASNGHCTMPPPMRYDPGEHGARISSDVLDELKTISSSKAGSYPMGGRSTESTLKLEQGLIES